MSCRFSFVTTGLGAHFDQQCGPDRLKWWPRCAEMAVASLGNGGLSVEELVTA
jgi:hypothetical protein